MPDLPPMSSKARKGYDAALRRIAECKKHGDANKVLNLSELGLTTLPPEIGQLTALTGLAITNNQLTTLPPVLGQLQSLTWLVLDHNQLTTLPPEIGQLSNLTELYLNNNQLTTLPSQLGQLHALMVLRLDHNRITTLPPEIGQITALTELWLHNNPLTTLPPQLGQLQALRELYLGNNHLTTLPPEIGQLSKLTKLWLYNNPLTMLPPQLGQLSKLTELVLHHNQLATLPPQLGQLQALTWLVLDHNPLTTLPPQLGQLSKLTDLFLHNNQLTTLPPQLGQITALRQLYLHDNPDLGLPMDVLGPTWTEVNRKNAKPAAPAAILAFYFRNRAAAVKRPILEAKVILVGWGAVGKTSLRRRLVDGGFNPKEDKTQKIEITPWEVLVGQDWVKLHLWDFGGQEIMHATHQFFLTKRSLYVLVLAGREKVQGAQEAEYWLRLIQSFGGGSPVLVVLNKQHQCPFDLNRQSLMEKYPFIKGFVQTDCEPTMNLDVLEKMILAEVDKLPELRTEFDAKWMAIKDAVTDLKQKGCKRMSVADYQTLCSRQGEEEEKWQRWLLGFLHDLGVVVCFLNDLRLRGDGALDPQWVVDGIYTVLNEPTLKGGDGRVDWSQTRALLSRVDYDDDDVRVLLELMEKFELCFPLPGSRDTLVVPELMTEQEAAWKTHFPDLAKCLRFELHYDFLPEGLVPRFIVATHDLSKAGERWRSGTILREGRNTALVRGDAVDRRVSIAVNGPEATRRDLLTIIRREFTKIHRSIPALGVKEMVPVPGLEVEPLSYDDLLAAEGAGDKDWPVVAGGVRHKVLIATLLDGIEPKEKRKARTKTGGITVEGDIVLGDKIKGDKPMNTDSHNITIGGNVTNAQVGQTLTNCINMIEEQAHGACKPLLQDLAKEVQQLLAKLPADKHEEVAGNLELMVKAVTNAKPNRAWYSVSAEGLMEAAKWVKDFTGNIAGTVGKLDRLLWPE